MSVSTDTAASSISATSPSVATVLDLYWAFRAGDIPAILAKLSPDVIWGEPDNPFNPAAGTRVGHTGFLEWVNIGEASEEVLALEPQHVLTNGDMVAVVGRTTCRAKSTGRTYRTDFVHLVTLRAGKIVRFQEFLDTYAAGEAFRGH
jgi:ketosteroid isomerase-like protein